MACSARAPSVGAMTPALLPAMRRGALVSVWAYFPRSWIVPNHGATHGRSGVSATLFCRSSVLPEATAPPRSACGCCSGHRPGSVTTPCATVLKPHKMSVMPGRLWQRQQSGRGICEVSIGSSPDRAAGRRARAHHACRRCARSLAGVLPQQIQAHVAALTATALPRRTAHLMVGQYAALHVTRNMCTLVFHGAHAVAAGCTSTVRQRAL